MEEIPVRAMMMEGSSNFQEARKNPITPAKEAVTESSTKSTQS